jgi:hypothetical protein
VGRTLPLHVQQDDVQAEPADLHAEPDDFEGGGVIDDAELHTTIALPARAVDASLLRKILQQLLSLFLI